MAQFLVAIGAAIFLALGALHGLLTLLFSNNLVIQALTLLIAASYFILSVRFWFWGPASARHESW